LGPSVQPWYLVWGIVILAVAHRTRTTTIIIVLTVAGSFLGVVGLDLLANEIVSLGLVLVALLIGVVLAAAITPVEITRVRRSAYNYRADITMTGGGNTI